MHNKLGKEIQRICIDALRTHLVAFGMDSKFRSANARRMFDV